MINRATPFHRTRSTLVNQCSCGLNRRPADQRIDDAGNNAVGNDRVIRAATRQAYASGEAANAMLVATRRRNDPYRVPERDPKDDPEPQSFNQRQLWFLEQIRMGERFSGKEIVQTWYVSLKTARRDISALLHSTLLEYIGSRRKAVIERIHDEQEFQSASSSSFPPELRSARSLLVALNAPRLLRSPASSSASVLGRSRGVSNPNTNKNRGVVT
jgi:hypothetical protein